MVYTEGTASGTNVVPLSALYGTTYVGGTGTCTIENEVVGCGTVFVVTEAKETVLHSFQGTPDGATPVGGLLRDKSENLYGTAAAGGAYDNGAVFRIRGKQETILYSFKGAPDGADPIAGLVQDPEGNLYGTMANGGINGAHHGGGAVFKLDSQGNETVLYSFCSEQNCADGEYPDSGLVMDASGDLYGTTYYGGTTQGSTNGSGTVFELDTSGHQTVLHSFCSEPYCADGASPNGGLVMDTSGNLYGTTTFGGTSYDGPAVIFKLDTSGRETVLYTFCSERNCVDGESPQAGLVMDDGGNFYGTTTGGGQNAGGTVFELDTSGTLTVLYSFPNPGPASPVGGLVMDTKGNLYGTASEGGPATAIPWNLVAAEQCSQSSLDGRHLPFACSSDG
jgi:uncharacterized repeat protein (TIGR03803 family)